MSMPSFEIVENTHEGVALVRCEGWGQVFQQVWARSTLRKWAWCAVCDRKMQPREKAYRPMTNKDNRSARACASHFDGTAEPR